MDHVHGFAMMIVVWCYIGWYLSHHPQVAEIIYRHGHIVTHTVLILLGVHILYESGSFSLLWKPGKTSASRFATAQGRPPAKLY